ncbi:hypothetical protein F2P79_025931 [Pimephales promelas]|nr:hypothetical protein F2P79_025931 [Pimephales promelas]
MDDTHTFRDGDFSPGCSERYNSPEPSHVSMKSDASMDQIITLKGRKTVADLSERYNSPEPSHVSMKSDAPMDQIITLKGRKTVADLREKYNSPEPSHVSMKSDASMDQIITLKGRKTVADLRYNITVYSCVQLYEAQYRLIRSQCDVTEHSRNGGAEQWMELMQEKDFRRDSHSPQSISTPGNEEEASGRPTSPRQQPVHRKEENMQGQKPLVKWPKSNSKEWETINTDLRLILNNIKGSAGENGRPYLQLQRGEMWNKSKINTCFPPPSPVGCQKSNNL